MRELAPNLVEHQEVEIGQIRRWDQKRLEALYVLALSTGMRRSEIFGLKWEDVDLDAGHLQVRRGLTVSPSGGVEIDDPKRFSSKRKIDLGSKTVAALKGHRKRQVEEKLKSPSWEESGFVFTTHQGGYLHPQTLYTAYFKPLRDRLSNGGDFGEGEEACNRRGSETEKANGEERALSGGSPPGTRDPAHQHNSHDRREIEEASGTAQRSSGQGRDAEGGSDPRPPGRRASGRDGEEGSDRCGATQRQGEKREEG